MWTHKKERVAHLTRIYEPNGVLLIAHDLIARNTRSKNLDEIQICGLASSPPSLFYNFINKKYLNQYMLQLYLQSLPSEQRGILISQYCTNSKDIVLSNYVVE